MAGGWTRDGAVSDQIDDTISDSVSYARARLEGEGTHECVECGEVIPEARRKAMPSARRCVGCQSGRDDTAVPGFNRRGSKDSQLR